jgi:hypothetical protein
MSNSATPEFFDTLARIGEWILFAVPPLVFGVIVLNVGSIGRAGLDRAIFTIIGVMIMWAFLHTLNGIHDTLKDIRDHNAPDGDPSQ